MQTSAITEVFCWLTMIERKIDAVSLNELRRKEMLAISEQGPLVAAGVAAIALLTKNPIESCIKERERVLNGFNQAKRSRKLQMITGLQKTCTEIAGILSPGCNESNISMNTRRLDLIQRLVISEIAEGPMVGDVADLVLGRFRFKVEGMQLYREWLGKEKKNS